MVTGPGAAKEGEVNEINPTDIVVCDYLDYKAWADHELPTFPDIQIDKDQAMDVLLAVTFLGI